MSLNSPKTLSSFSSLGKVGSFSREEIYRIVKLAIQHHVLPTLRMHSLLHLHSERGKAQFVFTLT